MSCKAKFIPAKYKRPTWAIPYVALVGCQYSRINTSYPRFRIIYSSEQVHACVCIVHIYYKSWQKQQSLEFANRAERKRANASEIGQTTRLKLRLFQSTKVVPLTLCKRYYIIYLRTRARVCVQEDHPALPYASVCF